MVEIKSIHTSGKTTKYYEEKSLSMAIQEVLLATTPKRLLIKYAHIEYNIYTWAGHLNTI